MLYFIVWNNKTNKKTKLFIEIIIVTLWLKKNWIFFKIKIKIRDFIYHKLSLQHTSFLQMKFDQEWEKLSRKGINFAIKERCFTRSTMIRKGSSIGRRDTDKGGRRIAHRPRGIIKLNRRQLNYRRPRLTAQLIIR